MKKSTLVTDKEYLDLQFKHAADERSHILDKVNSTEKEVKRINGSLAGVTLKLAKREVKSEQLIKTYLPAHKKLVKIVGGLEKKWIKAGGVGAGIVGTLGFIYDRFFR